MIRPRSSAFRGCVLTLAAIAALVTASARLEASSAIRLNDEQLVLGSTLIVEGRVVGVRSEWNAARTQIQTVVTLSVSRALKGKPASSTLTVRMLGGRMGDIEQELVGSPTFSIDEDVIVFFERSLSHPVPITGYSQGKLTVVNDATTGRRVIRERGIPHDEYVDSVTRIVASEGRR